MTVTTDNAPLMRNAPGTGLPLYQVRDPVGTKEAVMRRVTVQRPVVNPSTRRRREEAEEKTVRRSEIRQDIRRTWWPQD
ncbi:hypothetical protein HUT18_04180 [Streptomyces sp. NA04227]|uniref:hypothetical protein n=1 Tax=Streptomyces sp. NA04227 TaxID=2742136 RepID=UPI0015906186|nr:hypothetical protein [Streptomyces sp. NA04227]QKW04956.1 hypothetical protein HUT18_04180 [Streptomyces sp. NA04227]